MKIDEVAKFAGVDRNRFCVFGDLQNFWQKRIFFLLIQIKCFIFVGMDHISLFSGIGGFDIASEAVGWNNVATCEIDPFCRKVLKYYWPDSISYHDITKTDFTIHRGTIDILTGGFPCQPYSLAGKRLGKADARHLWPEMLRAIREIQPRWVVGENVRGLIGWNGGLVFDEVQADLEAAGYEVIPFVLPACGLNAPHRRDRVWFVAYNNSYVWGTRRNVKPEKQPRYRESILPTATERLASDTGSEQLQEWAFERNAANSAQDRTGLDNRTKRSGDAQTSSDAISRERLQRGFYEAGFCEAGRYPGECGTWGYWPTWENFPTQPPVCGGDDGLPGRLDGIAFSKWRRESIKAYGNAIVPQVAMQIFKVINQFESEFTIQNQF